MSELNSKKPTQYLQKLQQGGSMLDKLLKSYDKGLASKRDNTKTVLTPKVSDKIALKDEFGRLLQKPQWQGEIKTTPQKSLRETLLSKLNVLDRDGKSEVSKVVTEPLKASLRLLRPDKYFKGVTSDSDIPGAIGNLALDASQVVPAMEEISMFGKALRKGVIAGDMSISKVGRALEDEAIRGRALHLTDREISGNQLNNVGITAKQREGYVPGLSDLLYDRIDPFVYPESLSNVVDRLKSGNTTKEILNNPVKYADHPAYTPFWNTRVKQRDDAWRTYLGIPQRHNTFSLAEEFESSFKLKPNEERFKLNDEDLIKDSAKGLEKGTYRLGENHEVMGGYDMMGRGDNIVEYKDRWDLDPKFRTGLYKTIPSGSILAGETSVPITISTPVSKIVGKPFYSNGLVTASPVTKERKEFQDLMRSFVNSVNSSLTPSKLSEKVLIQDLGTLDINTLRKYHDKPGK